MTVRHAVDLLGRELEIEVTSLMEKRFGEKAARALTSYVLQPGEFRGAVRRALTRGWERAKVAEGRKT